MASIISAQSVPLPAASCCAGDDLRGSCLGRAGGRIRGGFRRGVFGGGVVIRGDGCSTVSCSRAGACGQLDRQFRVVGGHAAYLVADHPFDCGLDGGFGRGEFYLLGEAGLAGEGADLHLECLVVMAFRRRKLFHAAFERYAVARRKDDGRSVGAAFVGSHVVHMVGGGNRRFENDPVDIAFEVLHGAFPADVLSRGRRESEQRGNRQ